MINVLLILIKGNLNRLEIPTLMIFTILSSFWNLYHFIALDYLQIDFWNMVMFLQYWSHHYRSYGRHHELVDCCSVSMSTMKTDLFNVSHFSFPLSFTQHLTVYDQLGGCFLKKQRTLTLPMHLVHAPSVYWNASCSFTFVILYVWF